jgi:hypothetical protein
MKQLFFGLILLNLAAYGWFGLGPGKPAGGYAVANSTPLPAGVASLRLLGETEKLDVVEDTPATTASEPTVAFLDPYCFSIGPIPAKSTLREVRDLLLAQGIRAEARRDEYQEFSGNWIYLPPTGSRAEARQLVDLLNSKGIKDHLIVPSGEKKNAVSLGFFRNENSARDYLKSLQQLGFAPVMEENYRSGLRYWLDFTSNEPSPLTDNMIRNLDNQFEVGISPSGCELSG